MTIGTMAPDAAERWRRQLVHGVDAIIRRRFRVWLAAHLLMVGTWCGMFLQAAIAPTSPQFGLLLAAALASLLVSSMLHLCLLHALWSLIFGFTARTNPRDAVAYCFIPLFNIYWVSVAHWGLAEDLGEAMRLAPASGARPNLGLALIAPSVREQGRPDPDADAGLGQPLRASATSRHGTRLALDG